MCVPVGPPHIRRDGIAVVRGASHMGLQRSTFFLRIPSSTSSFRVYGGSFFASFCSGGTVVCLFVLVIVLSNGFLLLLCVFFLRSFFFHLFSPWVAGALFLVARFQRWNKE